MTASQRERRDERILSLIRAGATDGVAAKATGVSRDTARRVRVRAQVPSPYSGQQPTTPANIPPAAYGVDQPILSADPPQFREGYHDRTFTNWAAPVSYGGRTLPVARADIETHDSGASFLGSSILGAASTRFAPVYTALGVRCAPAIALPRQVDGGARGLARIVRDEVEAQLCPRAGLLPSPCFPATLWGAIAIDLALMGFAVLQHVYGPPDARGVRRIYTRRWPTWAVYYQPYRRTYVAITNEGPVDILNDGKFTLIGKTDIPHLQGAIRALMMPTLDGAQVVQARAQWIDRFSDPKFIATLPPDVAARSDVGKALQEALRIIRGPSGYGALPHGTAFEAVGLKAEASQCFGDALKSDNSYISAILTGVDTTADAGVYKPLVFWGILRSTVGDDLAAINRGINQGHVYPYTRFNYAAGIEEAEARGTWLDPVLSTPLPDPEKDARIEAEDGRARKLIDRIMARREAQIVTTQEDADAIADDLETPRIVLAEMSAAPVSRLDLAPTDLAKVVRVDEARASRELPPIGDERGDLTIAELVAMSKQKAAMPEQAPAPQESEAA
jgi:hypothetical protein